MMWYLMTESNKLLSFYTAWNFGCVDFKRGTADMLPHSGNKYDILDIHLTSLQQGKGCRPFAQCGQRWNYPVVD
jgi:hypothetical protein